MTTGRLAGPMAVLNIQHQGVPRKYYCETFSRRHNCPPIFTGHGLFRNRALTLVRQTKRNNTEEIPQLWISPLTARGERSLGATNRCRRMYRSIASCGLRGGFFLLEFSVLSITKSSIVVISHSVQPLVTITPLYPRQLSQAHA